MSEWMNAASLLTGAWVVPWALLKPFTGTLSCDAQDSPRSQVTAVILLCTQDHWGSKSSRNLPTLIARLNQGGNRLSRTLEPTKSPAIWELLTLMLIRWWSTDASSVDKSKMGICLWQWSCSVMSDSLRPHGLYSPWNSLGQNTGVGSLSLLQGIFPTQGSNPGWILY